VNRIRLLPDHVANQIAAGEVVERPASVVKELVENALDAQAGRIHVDAQAGGRSLIRVTDDGLGMSRDDALLCLERHATSKIRRAEDLASIATMGFRGEALPSIASVSRFTLTTRERPLTPALPPSGGEATDSESGRAARKAGEGECAPGAGPAIEGTQVVMNGGKIIEVKAAGCATGTSVEARQLFFNLPARRKFLRSEETERAHIQHYLMLAALAHPQVAFSFTHDGRSVWQLPGAKSGTDAASQLAGLRERLRAFHGAELKLLAVDFSGRITIAADEADAPSPQPSPPAGARESERLPNPVSDQSAIRNPQAAIRLWGFLGAPGVSRATREDQHLFVNRRPIENRGLNHALIEGYHTALMKGRFPVCCLFLELDPAEVDVNIHPAKREAKFHRERDVRAFVANAVRDTLLSFHRERAALEVQGSKRNVQSSPLPAPAAIPIPGHESKASPVVENIPQLPNFPLPSKPIVEWPSRPEQRPLQMGFAQPARSTEHVARPAQPATASHTLSVAPTPLLAVPLRILGVVGRLYVVMESDRGLVLMDQHAAHERVLFEQMLARLEANESAPSQRLLLPETVELAPRDAQFLRGLLPTLTRLGVGLGEFGDRTFLLDALPPMVKAPDARRFVLELVDELKAAGEGVNALRLGEHVVAKTVCRHAVKANDPLAMPELEALLADLRRCAMPYTCPHGRPTLIEMNFRELEKKFGRNA
jgi:DNA mismatch repair protein MutL